MDVIDIVDDFNKSGVDRKIIVDPSRSQISIYNSIRKYIKRHHLKLTVKLERGNIVLMKIDEAIRANT